MRGVVMKIAQVAPLHESVPPKYYGGTERIIYYLTEELVRQGHQVTLFASGDSKTSAKLQPMVDHALRLNPDVGDPLAYHIMMLDKVADMADEFDLIHFHIDGLQYPLMRHLNTPYITTLHGRLDLPHLAPLYHTFNHVPVVSISNHQRTPLPFANWQGTVYNGVPLTVYHFHPTPGDYLAFLGRMSPEKGIEQAIEIAIKAGMELRIAAKVDSVDQAYFENTIKPHLAHPLVNFIGEISETEKDDFLGNAYALLFPINWPEPFGLVMIEAMACGTPVIAFGCGSVPEVMRHGETGYIVNNVDEALKVLPDISKLNRQQCRLIFEDYFSSRRMAHDYLNVYQQLINEHTAPLLTA